MNHTYVTRFFWGVGILLLLVLLSSERQASKAYYEAAPLSNCTMESYPKCR